MKTDDFFIPEDSRANDDPWSLDPQETKATLNMDLLDEVRQRPLGDKDDLEVAMALVDLAQSELEAYGTDGSQGISNEGMGHVLRSMGAVLRRLGLSHTLPFRNFTTFRSHWLNQGASGSWQARRDVLDGLFDPLRAELLHREEEANDALAEPVSPRRLLDWPTVDQEIAELRRRFRSSTSPQDYRAVGTYCVGVLTALGQVVYDPGKHLRNGETVPPTDKTKQRLGRYVEATLDGPSSEDLRKLANAAIEFAHHVKHSDTPTRREAGIAADAVILLANMFRRLEQEF